MNKVLRETTLDGLYPLGKGKVRDNYGIPGHDDKILMIATDRISAFDVVMGDPVPGKGRILTDLSLFWLDLLRDIAPNHLITAEMHEYPEICWPYRNQLEGRSMIVRKVRVLPIEFIVRGYLSGSFWSAYKKATPENGIEGPYKEVKGHRLPGDMIESEKFTEPIFTPSTKAMAGKHDENISTSAMQNILALCLATDDIVFFGGAAELAKEVERISLALYKKAASYALRKGIIIADTKFELGILDGKLYLIDEVLTPDSSRFWPADQYAPGGGQSSFDKQYLRDYLQMLVNAGKWNKKAPAPPLPAEIIQATQERYEEALIKLTT